MFDCSVVASRCDSRFERHGTDRAEEGTDRALQRPLHGRATGDYQGEDVILISWKMSFILPLGLFGEF